MAKEYLDYNGLSHFKDKLDLTYAQYYDDLKAIDSKTYTDLYANPNNTAGGSFYFAKVIPDDYYKPWKVTYRLHAYVPNYSNYNGVYTVEMCGCQSSFISCHALNNFFSVYYRPIYYHHLYRATETGSTTYGHLLGARIYSATNGNNASYKRTFFVELLSQENCTVTLFDNALKYAEVDGTGSTNYAGLSEYNAYDTGVKMTGDANSQGQYMFCYNTKYFRTAVVTESIAVGDSTGYTQATAGATFDISYPMVWMTAAVAAGGTNYANTFVRHYDRNLTNVKSSFVGTPRKMVYMVVTLSGNIATIDDEIITDTLPTTEDGKVYIAIGRLGNQSNGKNYFIFQETHPMYYYKDGAIREYSYIPSEYVKDTDLSTVATSGSYADLSNKPTIPTVPTNVSAFTNDSGYITSSHEINNTRNIEYIVGTQTTATGAWTGVSEDTSLYDGKLILYFLPCAGSGNATLNLTLANGTQTGAIPVYLGSSGVNGTRMTTQLAVKTQGAPVLLAYDAKNNIWGAMQYWSDGNTYDRTLLNDVRVKAGTNGIFNYGLVMQRPDGTWESLTTSGGVGGTKAKNTHGFLFDKVWRYNYSNNITSGNLTTNDYLYDCTQVDLRYSTNCNQTLTVNKPVYLVGTVGNDGLFYLDDTWWTQTLPDTEDGKVYIYLGDTYNAYCIYFVSKNTALYYKDGAIREYSYIPSAFMDTAITNAEIDAIVNGTSS